MHILPTVSTIPSHSLYPFPLCYLLNSTLKAFIILILQQHGLGSQAVFCYQGNQFLNGLSHLLYVQGFSFQFVLLICLYPFIFYCSSFSIKLDVFNCCLWSLSFIWSHCMKIELFMICALKILFIIPFNWICNGIYRSFLGMLIICYVETSYKNIFIFVLL